jgi:hypothetical protein
MPRCDTGQEEERVAALREGPRPCRARRRGMRHGLGPGCGRLHAGLSGGLGQPGLESGHLLVHHGRLLPPRPGVHPQALQTQAASAAPKLKTSTACCKGTHQALSFRCLPMLPCLGHFLPFQLHFYPGKCRVTLLDSESNLLSSVTHLA